METPQGLPNLGSTCYFNALMQALVGSKIFMANIEGKYEQAFKSMDPAPFFDILPKESFDSHEAFLMLLDYLPKKIFELEYISKTPGTSNPKITTYVLSHSDIDYRNYDTSGGPNNGTLIDEYVLNNVPKLIVSFVPLNEDFVYNSKFIYDDSIDNSQMKFEDNMSSKMDDLNLAMARLITTGVDPRAGDNSLANSNPISHNLVNKVLLLGKKYKLISYVDYLGGHYVCTSIRGQKIYRFDDNSFTEIPAMTPVITSLGNPNNAVGGIGTTLYFYELELGFALSPNPFQVAHPIK